MFSKPKNEFLFLVFLFFFLILIPQATYIPLPRFIKEDKGLVESKARHIEFLTALETRRGRIEYIQKYGSKSKRIFSDVEIEVMHAGLIAAPFPKRVFFEIDPELNIGWKRFLVEREIENEIIEREYPNIKTFLRKPLPNEAVLLLWLDVIKRKNEHISENDKKKP